MRLRRINRTPTGPQRRCDMFIRAKDDSGSIALKGMARGFGQEPFREDYSEAQSCLVYRGKERSKIRNVLCLPVEEFLKNLKPLNPLRGDIGSEATYG